MTIEDEDNYQKSLECCICDEKIIDNKDKARDCCHITVQN